MPAVQASAPAGGGVTQTVLDAATAGVISVLRAGAPSGEDTFDEVSDLLGTLTTAVAGKQPSDSDLAAIALLGTTTYGRAVLELADAASGRTYLGLGSAATAASTAFDAAGAAAAAQAASQPVDSDLTAVAALSTTSYGRGVLALADASALRSTAGLVLGTDVYSKSAVDSGFAPLSSFPIGAWTAYTPAWTSSGTAPSLGNGTIVGKYIQLGKTIHFRLKIIWGSTTTGGTGTWFFSLPAAPHADYTANTAIEVNGYAEDNGVAGHNIGGGRINTGSTILLHNGTSGNPWTTTSPFTWGNGDYLSIHGSYEAA